MTAENLEQVTHLSGIHQAPQRRLNIGGGGRIVEGQPGRDLAVGLDLQTDVDAAQAFGRHLLSYVSAMFLFFGYFFNLFTAKRQTFHDLMVGAVVIRSEVSTEQPWFEIWKSQIRSIVGAAEGLKASGTDPRAQSRSETLETLEQLHKLHQQGVLSDDEYKTKKEELLKDF